jgi:hypothetical protein
LFHGSVSLWFLINALTPILFSIRANLPPILSSFRTSNPDGVIPTLHHFLFPVLRAFRPVVPAILPPLHPRRLRETGARDGKESNYNQEQRQKMAAW